MTQKRYRVIRNYGGAAVGSLITPDHGVADALLRRKCIEPYEEKPVEDKSMQSSGRTKNKRTKAIA
jgi:hypothetical protein